MTELNVAQRAAIDVFKAKNGRYWKSKLRTLWMSGNYSRHGVDVNQAALLQQIRNNFGPQWLLRHN